MKTGHVATNRIAALAAAVFVLMAIVACSNSTRYVNLDQPPPEPGFFAFAFERIAPPRINSVGDESTEVDDWTVAVWDGPLTSPNIRIEPTGRSGVLRFGESLYVNAEFRVHNDGATPLERLVLVGYRHEAFRVASAISQPRLGSVPAPDVYVRRIAPTHRMTFDAAFVDAGEALLGDSGASHFIAFDEAEVPELLGPAGYLGLLPYGYSVGGGIELAPGGHAPVWLAFTVPVGPASTAVLTSFVWNAVLLTAPDVRVAQAPAEQHARGWAAVLERTAAAGATRIVAIGAGERQVPAGVDCDQLVGLADVRIAGEGPEDEAYVGLIDPARVEAPVFVGCEGASP